MFNEYNMLDPNYNSDLEMKTIQYDPNGKPNSQRAIDEALTFGLSVVFPKDNELQLDIDNDHSFQLYLKQADILKKYIGVEGYKVEPSRSGLPKQHITITLSRTVSTIERLALQAMMGSDRVRELLGFVQYLNNDPHPVLFLEKGPVKGLLGSTSDIQMQCDAELEQLHEESQDPSLKTEGCFPYEKIYTYTKETNDQSKDQVCDRVLQPKL
jgi:hypothetical protein